MLKNIFSPMVRILFVCVELIILSSAPAEAGGALVYFAKNPKHAAPEPKRQEVEDARRKNHSLAEMSAVEQRDSLWREIERTKYTGPLPTTIDDGAMRTLHMLNDSSFLETIFSGEFTPCAHGNFKKYTHKYGTVAQVEFIPTRDLEQKDDESTVMSYSGLFSKKVLGLLRLSQITIGSMGKVNPSSALHLFVDQSQMISLVGMPSIDGQPTDPNFFLNPFTNVPGPANKEPATLIIDTFTSTLKNLPKFSGYITIISGKKLAALSLGEPSSILPTGKRVEKIYAPFEISLEAPADVIARYETVKNSGGDFRDLIAENFKSGSTIFEVYARDQDDAIFAWCQRWVDEKNSANYYKTGKMFNAGSKKLIGVIKVTSPFVASKAGDDLRARHAI